MHYSLVSTGTLLHRVFRDCAKWGIKVELTPFKLRGCYGYFDGAKLVVSTRRPEWVTVLAHEFAHAEQFHQGEMPEDEHWLVLDRWLKGARVAYHAVEWATAEIMACEVGAERRARALLDYYDVSYDRPKFIRDANLNVFGYELQLMWRRPAHGLARFTPLARATPNDRIITHFPQRMYDAAEDIKGQL